jgi:hypothetical protein
MPRGRNRRDPISPEKVLTHLNLGHTVKYIVSNYEISEREVRKIRNARQCENDGCSRPAADKWKGKRQCRECICPELPLTGDDYMMAIHGYGQSPLAEMERENINDSDSGDKNDMSFYQMSKKLTEQMDIEGFDLQFRNYNRRNMKKDEENVKRTVGDRDTSSADKI